MTSRVQKSYQMELTLLIQYKMMKFLITGKLIITSRSLVGQLGWIN